MEPVVAPLMTEISLALCYLICVVGECVVDAAAVNVKIFTEMLHTYAAALDMPAGVAYSPRAVPLEFLIVKL